MAQAPGFQPDHAGSIPAIHSSNSRQSMACNAKRSSEQSFKLPISGFEPRARHQYPRAFPPKVSRVKNKVEQKMDWVAQTDKRTGKLDHRKTEQVWHRSKTVAGFGCTGWRLGSEVFSSGFVTCRRKRVSSERQCLCAGSNPVPFPNDLEPYGMGLRCKRRSSRFDSERGLQFQKVVSVESVRHGRVHRLENGWP
jgi:hypothetical protein